MSRFFRWFRTERLQNTGSLARDLLAGERTFLAWTRTGLGFIALGVALEKVEAFVAISPTLLRLENSNTKLAAGTLVGTGSLIVLHGTSRYFGMLKDLQEGYYRPNRIGIMGLAMVSVGVAFAGTLLVLENEAEKDKEKAKDDAVRIAASTKGRP
ncbi:hypothetical protein LTR78_010155 [Recurvomyces mirabilis]|uniref:DUF202 domain-containing protein n=1 Tax=Recurvomyces mirabilis TaxID=574656 RepID=A0AAE0WIB8_9PEZI|nr:hypothetical protein LTR78_010155 [Recurvomyces mirabilis]KAK5149946.1 hypothetical protein LTS14_010551 [Recurvomyces mirabilis]